jgi:ABC-2 type transport system ATP-binding protein
MENAERMCDSVCIIARGEKVLDGQVTDVRTSSGRRNVALALAGNAAMSSVSRPSENGVGQVLRDTRLVRRFDDNNRYFEIELAPGADAQELLHRLIDAGARIERFELVLPSLHQIFIERVGASGVETGMSGHG